MELSGQTLQGLAEVIRRVCGVVIGPDKAYLVRHRLAPVVEKEGLASFEQLLERLQGRAGMRLHDAIIEAITTKETSFFRDHAFFQALGADVLPECVRALRQADGRRHRVRVWSAGCSTGQEPYSVAMLIRDQIAAGGAGELKDSQFTILATDLSTEAIAFARAGEYRPADVARGLSEAILARHFHRHGKHWVVDEALQRLVHFRRLDLLHPPASQGGFDLILCRNVLIYFDEPSRRRVCEGLYGALHGGGWLGLGAAESLYGMKHRFETVKFGRVVLYRKPPESRHA